ncbi:DUF455 family protein [Paenibacillus piri]|uniref:DUF455 family protein n=1 Tax=Paenibacillus piri TaxID=2547395 RepID=A0A4R5KKL3_9BACL|nr:DUF455 family protein [Paenibacillus piri]TDF95395.1 DUF455 family protein [Paenibacillus piri]
MSEQVIVMGNPGKRSVEEASSMIKRLYFIERELMRTLGGYVVNVSDWELKKTLPRHIWEDSLRADALRTRVLEMRYPRRDVDKDHDPKLELFLSSLIRCSNDSELLAGVYLVTKEALLALYESYLQDADPLDDAPTIAFMKGFIPQIQHQLAEARTIYSQLAEDKSEAGQWQRLLEQFLINSGGLSGKDHGSGEIPASIAGRSDYVPPLAPKRDPRFTSALYHMPPRLPEKFIERQVWQGINHVNEIWAAEIPDLVLWKWNDMPWEFYLECARWAYDESRHCMMGEQRLKAWGFEAGVDYPVIADHYRSVSDQGELAVLALLHALETNGPSWKSGLKADFEAAGDTASSQDFDYDWADESIHLLYGYKWVLHRLDNDLDALEDYKIEVKETWQSWIKQRHQEWNYEPFNSRLQQKIAEIEARLHG